MNSPDAVVFHDLTDSDLMAWALDHDASGARARAVESSGRAIEELVRRAVVAERKRGVALLLSMAADAERFATSGMARLDDLAKAGAFREAARRVAGLG